MNKTYKYILVLLVSIIVAYYNSGKEETELSGLMPVSRVVDGDTFWAEDGSKKGVKIRLIGVDAPETRNGNYKKIGFYGQEAKAYLTDLLINKEVLLEYGVDSLDRQEFYRFRPMLNTPMSSYSTNVMPEKVIVGSGKRSLNNQSIFRLIMFKFDCIVSFSITSH